MLLKLMDLLYTQVVMNKLIFYLKNMITGN